MDNKQLVSGGDKDSLIICRNSQGAEVRASLLRLTRYMVVFEVYNPYSIVQLSEVLSDFRIIMNERMMYSGRAVVTNLVNTGIMLICEATLGEEWLDVDLFSPVNQRDKLRLEFTDFVKEWSKVQMVRPEFKVVVADMQTLLMDLRRWLEQVELGIRSTPTGDRMKMEREVVTELQEPMLPLVNDCFAKFDGMATSISEELRPTHRAYARRMLHPLVLCAPFVYRTYQKPLGYAGDYEMVNMILRDPAEGGSLFAKIVNVSFLNQPPAVAHRNRITYLTRKLTEETRRRVRSGKMARIFNLGCGPAREVQNFLTEDDLCDRAHFTLLDFNDETLDHTRRLLEDLKRLHRRGTPLYFVKKSVHQILKESVRGSTELTPGGYDFVYCAGLFDYMSDRICKRLMNIFYELLAPGGLLVATNVDANKPFRYSMEFLLEWHLICRDPKQIAALLPEGAPPESMTVAADVTGANVFVEIRKPENV